MVQAEFLCMITTRASLFLIVLVLSEAVHVLVIEDFVLAYLQDDYDYAHEHEHVKVFSN